MTFVFTAFPPLSAPPVLILPVSASAYTLDLRTNKNSATILLLQLYYYFYNTYLALHFRYHYSSSCSAIHHIRAYNPKFHVCSCKRGDDSTQRKRRFQKVHTLITLVTAKKQRNHKATIVESHTPGTSHAHRRRPHCFHPIESAQPPKPSLQESEQSTRPEGY